MICPLFGGEVFCRRPAGTGTFQPSIRYRPASRLLYRFLVTQRTLVPSWVRIQFVPTPLVSLYSALARKHLIGGSTPPHLQRLLLLLLATSGATLCTAPVCRRSIWQ